MLNNIELTNLQKHVDIALRKARAYDSAEELDNGASVYRRAGADLVFDVLENHFSQK